jgi:tetratricopeptide (TPR) repeat protein
MEDEKLRIERIHVVPRDPNAAVGGAPQGPVSSTDLMVPAKAKKEFDKGAEAFAKENYKKAVQHFEASVSLYPQYARAWNDLGVAKAKAGDELGAKEAWNRSLKADDKFISPSLNLARVAIAERHPSEAERFASQALTRDPKNPEALYVLFTAQYRQNETKQALETESKLHAMAHSRYADVHVYAGQLLLNRDEQKLAMAEFETYLKEAPDGPRATAVRKAMSQIQALQSSH